MPARLDRCVSDLVSKWKKDPSSVPKNRKAGQDLKSLAFAICRASTKLESQNPTWKYNGPTLVNAAITAKPVLRQRGREIKIVELEGQKFVEVPLLRKGIYNSPYGTLVFNQPFIDKIINNHDSAITDYAVSLDFRHADTRGALAFLDKDDGGWLEQKEDGWLYAYGKPTDKEAEDIVNSRRWRYSSPEIWLDYNSNLVQKLSFDRDSEEAISPVTLEQYYDENYKEIEMGEKLVLGDMTIIYERTDDGIVTLSGDDFTNLSKILERKDGSEELKAELEQKDAVIEELQGKIANLEKKDDDPDPDVPEAVRIQLEQMNQANAQLREDLARKDVAYVLKQAEMFVDERGMGHSKILLELAQKAMLFEPVERDGAVIKLSQEATVEDYKRHIRTVIALMLESIGGQVPIQGKTGEGGTHDGNPLFDGGESHYTKEELEVEWENFGKF